jgi:hypothetical protein
VSDRGAMGDRGMPHMSTGAAATAQAAPGTIPPVLTPDGGVVSGYSVVSLGRVAGSTCKGTSTPQPPITLLQNKLAAIWWVLP